jgi:hypothetical protein
VGSPPYPRSCPTPAPLGASASAALYSALFYPTLRTRVALCRCECRGLDQLVHLLLHVLYGWNTGVACAAGVRPHLCARLGNTRPNRTLSFSSVLLSLFFCSAGAGPRDDVD